MLLYNIFFLPLMTIMSGYIIKDYDPKVYKYKPKYISQNGVNLTFLKFTDAQWEYFLKVLTKKYFMFSALLSLIFNLISQFLITKIFEIDPMMLNFIFWIITNISIFILMIYKTKKVIKK